MPTRLPACLQKALCLFVLLSIARLSQAQCTFTRLDKVTLPTNQWIGDGGFVKGLLRVLPSDYAVNTTKKYPIVIYFHGLQAVGDGSANDLCKVHNDATFAMPGRIEAGALPTTMTIDGVTQEYIALMPQYTNYGPTGYGDRMEAVIDYAVANYRVDPSRIYLTGMSSGSNLILDYVSSSAARSQRIAAVALSSMCWDLDYNTAGPANITAGGLPVWFVNCELDGPCVIQFPDEWVDALQDEGATQIRYSRLPPTPNPQPWPFPDSLQIIYCRPFPHDTWSALYNTKFNHAGGPNLLGYFQQNARTTLPLQLKQYSVRLAEQQVQLHWSTFQELGNASFTIERAGADGRFTVIAQIPAAKNEALEHHYQYADLKPLSQVSYYRLSQTDIDGRKTILGTRTIINREGNTQLLLLGANPFSTQLSAFINTPKAQRVTLELVDHNGRRLSANSVLYQSGVSEAKLPTGHLPAGVYFIRVRGELKTETHKVIKQ